MVKPNGDGFEKSPVLWPIHTWSLVSFLICIVDEQHTFDAAFPCRFIRFLRSHIVWMLHVDTQVGP